MAFDGKVLRSPLQHCFSHVPCLHTTSSRAEGDGRERGGGLRPAAGKTLLSQAMALWARMGARPHRPQAMSPTWAQAGKGRGQGQTGTAGWRAVHGLRAIEPCMSPMGTGGHVQGNRGRDGWSAVERPSASEDFSAATGLLR